MTMKIAILASLLTSAAAFAPAQKVGSLLLVTCYLEFQIQTVEVKDTYSSLLPSCSTVLFSCTGSTAQYKDESEYE